MWGGNFLHAGILPNRPFLPQVLDTGRVITGQIVDRRGVALSPLPVLVALNVSGQAIGITQVWIMATHARLLFVHNQTRIEAQVSSKIDQNLANRLAPNS